MSYATIEAALLTVIQKHADFLTTSSRGDYRLLAKGLERAAILRFGAMRYKEITIAQVLYVWTINVDLYVPWRGEINTWLTQIETEKQKLIDTIVAWPQLSGTAGVIDVRLAAPSAPEAPEVTDAPFRGQTLIVEVDEIVSPGRQE